MAKKQGKMTNFFYGVAEIFNVGSTVLLIYLIFFAPMNEVNTRAGVFLMWLNITTHITTRTKNIQSNEETR